MIKDKRFWIVFLVVLTLFSLGYDVFFREPEPTPEPVRITAAPAVRPSATPRVTVPTSKPKPVEPYEGMYVIKIPSEWEWMGDDNTTVITAGGERVKTTKYNYDTSKRGYTIWVAKDSSKIVKLLYYDKVRSTPKPSPRRSVAPTPDVSGFSHAEDFYDWYYDDFDDYEDAEDWYEEHGGW